MKNYLVILILLIVGFSNKSHSQSCAGITPTFDPLANTDILAKAPKPLNELLGINAGFEVERFNSNFNSPVTLNDLNDVCSFVRFFYQQDKDYQIPNPSTPGVPTKFTPLNFNFSSIIDSDLNLVNSARYFNNNFSRIQQIKNAGLKVAAAIEISTRGFPDKWWTSSELGSTPQVIQANGEDWATAFLKVYDPKLSNGGFPTTPPIVDILELGNEPWGAPGKEAYRNYLIGILEAFKTYYGNSVSNFRIELAGAAFQAHEHTGTLYGQEQYPNCAPIYLNDWVGDMIGHQDLTELRSCLTQGIGVHNYNFDEYWNLDVFKITKHPELANGGFSMYKNMSKWVSMNMPNANTQKLNATEFGWNSDTEPSRAFQCSGANAEGNCLQGQANYNIVTNFNSNGCDWNYLTSSCKTTGKTGIGRTAQAAYTVRSILMLARWGANQIVAYNLMDDWTNRGYYSNGLIDGTKPNDRDEYDIIGTESNPYEEKESWYAVKRLKDQLGSKHFLRHYGTENDGGVYCYLFGDDNGNSTGKPTHMVVWRAVDLNTLPGVIKNFANNESNITTAENATDLLTLSNLNLPSGITINTSGSATYIDGRENDLSVPVSQIFSGGNITATPFPIIIPLNSTNCSINYFNGQETGCGSGSTFNCPAISANFGDSCDDSNPNTMNDFVQTDCTCAGSMGMPAGSTINFLNNCTLGFSASHTSNSVTVQGSTTFQKIQLQEVNPVTNAYLTSVVICDNVPSNNIPPCNTSFTYTIPSPGGTFFIQAFNDVWSTCDSDNFTASGTGGPTFDCPTISANIGDACNDNDPNTSNDTVQSNCTCAGTPSGPTLDCPALNANIGDACNDNDPNTSNDTVQSNCTCAGNSAGSTINFLNNCTLGFSASHTSNSVTVQGSTTFQKIQLQEVNPVTNAYLTSVVICDNVPSNNIPPCNTSFTYTIPSPGGTFFIQAFNDVWSTCDSDNFTASSGTTRQANPESGVIAVTDKQTVNLSENSESLAATKSYHSSLSVLLYPNPVNDKLYISFDRNLSFNKGVIKFYNSIGALVKEIKVSDSLEKMEINVSDLRNGLYYLGIYQDSYMISTKPFIVNK